MDAATVSRTGRVLDVGVRSSRGGPGIRTVVTLKGCPMRCPWCDTPEIQSPLPELAYDPAKCLTIASCGRCLEVCTAGALTRGPDDRVVLDRRVCALSMFCAEVCPSRALAVLGQTASASQVMAQVAAASPFHIRSGGGMTIGGGEPLLQPGFVLELLGQARRLRIHAALETTGSIATGHLEAACGLLDALVFVLRSMDNAKHQDFTGLPVAPILENFRMVRELFPELPVVVRTLIVPGFNDTEEEILAVAEHVKTFPGTIHEIAAYHPPEPTLYARLGREFAWESQTLDKDRAQVLFRLAQAVNESARLTD